MSSSLSVSNVKKTLDLILEEHRNGRREPSLLSHALLKNKAVAKDELFAQVSSDLEDKDVHPDSITLNEGYISSWLSSVMSQGGLDEAIVEALPPVPIDMHSLARHPNLDSVRKDAEDMAEDHGEGLRREIPHHPRPELGLPAQIEDGAAFPRPESTSSHRSKPEDWYPTDRPDPEYVYSMLCPFFQRDFHSPPSLPESRLRILRAFHQQDWSHRGFLTRPDVIQICSEVLKRSGVSHEVNALRGRAETFDTNRGGQIDRQEFISLMNDLIKVTALVREREAVDKIRSTGRKAGGVGSNTSKYDFNVERATWMWERTSEPNGPYLDKITGTRSSRPPPSQITDSSFTTMALEADVCVGKINDFQNHWLGIVPQPLQSKFLSALNAVRNTAIQFTPFEA